MASLHVPDAHGREADGRLDLPHGLFVALGAHQIVAGHVGVAGVQADADRRGGLEPRDQFGYLLEAAAQGELRPGGVFNQDVKRRSLPRKPVDGAGNGVGGKFEALVAGQSLP